MAKEKECLRYCVDQLHDVVSIVINETLECTLPVATVLLRKQLNFKSAVITSKRSCFLTARPWAVLF